MYKMCLNCVYNVRLRGDLEEFVKPIDYFQLFFLIRFCILIFLKFNSNVPSYKIVKKLAYVSRKDRRCHFEPHYRKFLLKDNIMFVYFMKYFYKDSENLNIKCGVKRDCFKGTRVLRSLYELYSYLN
jgi:hypothetical protein